MDVFTFTQVDVPVLELHFLSSELRRWFSGRTSVQDGDGLLGERRTGPPLRSGAEIKLVARAVMEVVQRYAAVIGRQIQLLQQTQVMTAVDWRRSESGKRRGHVISANHKLGSQTAVPHSDCSNTKHKHMWR